MISSVTNHRYRLALLGILLLAFALRLAGTGELRMWGDEAYSVYSAQRSLIAITFEGAENDPHPPLYYYLLHFYLPLAGASELALRFFSVFPGVLTVALVYRISRMGDSSRPERPTAGRPPSGTQMLVRRPSPTDDPPRPRRWTLGRRPFRAISIAHIAAALAAIAPFHIYYSQEIRMYALAICLTTLALYFLLRLWRNESRLLWIGYAVTTLLALYTLYHTAFVLLAEGLVLLAFIKSRRAFVLRWFAISFGAVVLFVPWLLFRFSATLGHLEGRAGHTVLALPMFVARGFAALTVGTTLAPATALVLAALFLGLILIGLVLIVRARSIKTDDLFLISLAIVPIIAVYPLYLLLPILVGRLFALAFVPLILLLARSIAVIGERARLAPVPVLLVVAGIFGYSLNDYYFHFDRYNPAAEDYMPVIQSVERRAAAGDVVLFHARWQIGYFLSHYHGPPIEYRALDDQADVESATNGDRNVWAVVQGLGYHDSEAWLTQHAFFLSEQSYGQMRLLAYRAGTPARGERYATSVDLNNGMALLGYRLNGAPLESGRDSATVELDWQASQAIPEDWTISVRLVSLVDASRGQAVFAQEDKRPVNGHVPTTSWQPGQQVVDRPALAIPPGTPPGNYRVQIVVYDSSNGRTASIIAPDNLRGQSLTLGEVTVVKPSEGSLAHGPRSIVPSGAKRINAAWNEIALVALDGVATGIGQGDTIPLTLYWQARSKPTRDYTEWIQVVDSSGATHPPLIARPANDSFSTLDWDAGETWVDRIQIKIPANTAPGPAMLLIGLIDAKTGQVVMPQTELATRELPINPPVVNAPAIVRAVVLSSPQVTGRAHHFEMPSPTYPLQARLGSQIKFLGYDLPSQVYSPGGMIRLNLYWQSLGLMDERYTVFVHVISPEGDLIAQKDNEPQAGGAPTTSWIEGEVISDAYAIPLPNSLAPGVYAVEVGMYQAATGSRLPVAGAKNEADSGRILLGAVKIPAP